MPPLTELSSTYTRLGGRLRDFLLRSVFAVLAMNASILARPLWLR